MGEIELESELRILEVDEDDVVTKIVGLGGIKVFDGRMETRIFRSSIADGQQRISTRLRFVEGLEYLIGSRGSSISRQISHTDRVSKRKLSTDSVPGVPTPRGYLEERRASYGGNNLDVLSNEYEATGIKMIAWDKRKRVSYEASGGRRFELDRFLSTMTLGDKAIPLMLEIQTQDAGLTREVVEQLGYKLVDPRVVDWKLGRIFDHYSRQPVTV